MEALSKTDIPVPKVYWFDQDEDVIGTSFDVIGVTHGAIPPYCPPYHFFGMVFDSTPEQRTKMWWGGLEAIAKIHKVDWAQHGIV